MDLPDRPVGDLGQELLLLAVDERAPAPGEPVPGVQGGYRHWLARRRGHGAEDRVHPVAGLAQPGIRLLDRVLDRVDREGRGLDGPIVGRLRAQQDLRVRTRARSVSAGAALRVEAPGGSDLRFGPAHAVHALDVIAVRPNRSRVGLAGPRRGRRLGIREQADRELLPHRRAIVGGVEVHEAPHSLRVEGGEEGHLVARERVAHEDDVPEREPVESLGEVAGQRRRVVSRGGPGRGAEAPAREAEDVESAGETRGELVEDVRRVPQAGQQDHGRARTSPVQVLQAARRGLHEALGRLAANPLRGRWACARDRRAKRPDEHRRARGPEAADVGRPLRSFPVQLCECHRFPPSRASEPDVRPSRSVGLDRARQKRNARPPGSRGPRRYRPGRAEGRKPDVAAR